MSLPTSIGIELELNNQAGVNHDVANLQRVFGAEFPSWVVKTDGSCGDHGRGIEINSPILRTEQDLKTVETVCDRLKSLGFKTTPKCGFHVHLGIRDLIVANQTLLTRFLVQHEDVFFNLAPDRRGNTYTAPLAPGILRNLRGGGSWGSWTSRFHWINGEAFRRHGTLEFRLMSGSLNPRQIVGWVNLLLHIYNMVVRNQIDADLLTNFEKDAKTGEELLQQFAAMLRISTESASEREDLPQEVRERAELARDYLFTRWDDVRSDSLSIRAERRRRRLAAWKGEEQFTPILARKGVTNDR